MAVKPAGSGRGAVRCTTLEQYPGRNGYGRMTCTLVDHWNGVREIATMYRIAIIVFNLLGAAALAFLLVS